MSNIYNLNTLLHRNHRWTVTLPDGTSQSGTTTIPVPVRIPRIQRDYAEGRDIESVRRKRHSLLNDILDVVYGFRESLSFDFIYGYLVSHGKTVTDPDWHNSTKYPGITFEPLDGQQRLTTLFLIYWLFGRRADLTDIKREHSLFIYETRDTSEEFCHWLVSLDAAPVIREWQTAVATTMKRNEDNKKLWSTARNTKGTVDPFANRLRFPLAPVPTLSDYMQTIDSFKWDWHDDPNIRSMMTVLESAVRSIKERGLLYDDGVAGAARLDNVTFMLLDNLAADGDRLFEKMNARGKALTGFEILKSSLEEEMERQAIPQSDPGFADKWRRAIDGDWIDFCWDKSRIGPDPSLETVRKVEQTLERLLIRISGKSLFLTDISATPNASADAIDYAGLLETSLHSRESVNDVIDRYLEYARHERSLGNRNLSTLDFKSIYRDIRNLIYKDSSGWHDATAMLMRWNSSDNNTLLDDFMSDAPTHDTRVMIYAMLAWLDRILPAAAIAANATERANFNDWMRFIRNVYNSDNKSTRLDNFTDVQAALRAIDRWLDTYKASYRKNSTQDVLHLVLGHIKANAHGQEQARLDEEALKAGLRINGTLGQPASDWEKSILKAEDNFYLWGQIIAPLSWSVTGQNPDKNLFDSYMRQIDIVFRAPLPDRDIPDALLIQTLLCYDDCRQNLRNGLGSLGRLNNHRDYSWKQYLRRQDASTGYHGLLFKRLFDSWLSNPTYSFERIMRDEISLLKKRYTISDWQYYIVNLEPDTLLSIFEDVGTSGRYVLTESGRHPFLFRSNTMRTTYRYDLLTLYLHYKTSLHSPGVTSEKLTSTADEEGAYVEFAIPSGETIRLSAGDDDRYDIAMRVTPAQPLATLFTGLTVPGVENELKRLNVITGL